MLFGWWFCCHQCRCHWVCCTPKYSCVCISIDLMCYIIQFDDFSIDWNGIKNDEDKNLILYFTFHFQLFFFCSCFQFFSSTFSLYFCNVWLMLLCRLVMSSKCYSLWENDWLCRIWSYSKLQLKNWILFVNSIFELDRIVWRWTRFWEIFMNCAIIYMHLWFGLRKCIRAYHHWNVVHFNLFSCTYSWYNVKECLHE